MARGSLLPGRQPGQLQDIAAVWSASLLLRPCGLACQDRFAAETGEQLRANVTTKAPGSARSTGPDLADALGAARYAVIDAAKASYKISKLCRRLACPVYLLLLADASAFDPSSDRQHGKPQQYRHDDPQGDLQHVAPLGERRLWVVRQPYRRPSAIDHCANE